MRIFARARDYLILFLCSLLPFWRFSWSAKGIFNPSDFNFPLHIDYIFKSYLFTWNPNFGSGFSTVGNWLLLDTFGPWLLLKFLGFSLAQIQIIYFVGVYFLLGFGMYFFITNFFNFKNQVIKSLAGITSGLFYMFNFYTFQFTMGVPHLLISFALFPVLLIFLIRILQEKRFLIQLRRAIIFGLVSLFFLAADPAHNYIYSLAFLIFIILYFPIMRLDWKITARGISLVLFFVILLNMWWALPLWISMFRSEVVAQVVKPEYNRVVLDAMNNTVSVFEVLRLTHTHDQFGAILGGDFSWPTHLRNFYRSPFSLALFFGLLFFMLLTLKDKRYFKKLLVLSMLGVIGIGFSLGASAPFFIWRIFLWFFNNIPGFVLLRNFTKFRAIALFWYASMFGILVSIIYERLSTLIRKELPPIILVLGALLIVLLNSPQYLGGDLGGKLTFFQPPDYYSQANEWLKRQRPHFRTAILPQPTMLELYEWGPNYDMISIVINTFTRPLLVWIHSPQTKEIIRTFANEEGKIRTPFSGKIMKLVGAKFIMTRNDLLPASLSNARAHYIEDMPLELGRQKNISHERQFDRLNFYRNHYYEPNHIYSSPTASLIEGGISTFIPLSYTALLDEKSAIFFTTQVEKGEKAAKLLEKVDRVIVTRSVEDLIAELIGGDEQLIEKCREILKAKKVEYLFYREEKEPLTEMNLEVSKEGMYNLRITIATELPRLIEDTPILKIDGKLYLLREFSKEKIWEKEFLLERKEAFFKGGRHSFEIVAPREIEVRMVFLEVGTERKNDGVATTVEFIRINPTRYRVKLRTDQPGWLIFSESFNREWKAYIRQISSVGPQMSDKKYEWSALMSAWRDRKERMELKEHFMVNGYANGWHITADQLAGHMANEVESNGQQATDETEIVMEYMPQRFLEGGTAVSGLGLVLCLAYLAIASVRSVKSERKNGSSLN